MGPGVQIPAETLKLIMTNLFDGRLKGFEFHSTCLKHERDSGGHDDSDYISPRGVGRSRRYCNTGSTRSKGGASP